MKSTLHVIERLVDLEWSGRFWAGTCFACRNALRRFHAYDDMPLAHYHCFECGQHGDAADAVVLLDGGGRARALAKLQAAF